MKCPYGQELKDGKIVCDFMGVKPIASVEQCPTEIFNKCQDDALEDKEMCKSEDKLVDGYIHSYVVR